MLKWLKNIDALLRGDLRQDGTATDGTIDFPLGRIVCVSVVLAAMYGASVGSFAVVSAKGSAAGWMQLVASAVKAPLLFYLTLLVTFPSLYVFNALMGSRLGLLAALRLLVAAIAVMVAILASLGPIIVFFAFSTPSGLAGYRFILLLVVVLSSAAGVLGLGYLLRMLNRYAGRNGELTAGLERVAAAAEPAVPLAEETSSTVVDSSPRVVTSLYPPGGQSLSLPRPMPGEWPVSPAGAIFRVWVFVFAVVGAQMSWVLRPFVGSPDLPFTWFRERSGNFFQSVWRLLWQVLGGEHLVR